MSAALEPKARKAAKPNDRASEAATKVAGGAPDQAAERSLVRVGGREGADRAPDAFASYQEATKWLYDLTNLEQLRQTRVAAGELKLDRMHALMERLGNPQSQVRMVHVAGSKGKGSVVEMTASMLAGCGYTVGVYTSPHLVDVRERIRVISGVREAPVGSESAGGAWSTFASGELISYPALTGLLGRVRAAIATAPRKLFRELGQPSFFEVMTACAFCHFAEQAVDLAVIEVGLGGRLDATNVIRPEVCAITAIQLEHTQILGSTVELIAAEKAGIMKPGVPCLTVGQGKGVLEVMRAKAESVGTVVRVLGKEVEYSSRFEVSHDMGPHMRVCVSLPKQKDASGRPIGYEHLAVPLKGEHQAANCGLALAIVCQLVAGGGPGGLPPMVAHERDVARGLASTSNHGRMELVWRKPRIMVDGAHNPESVESLVKAIGAQVPYDSMVAIFGCASDKDIGGMLQALGKGGDKVIFTRSSNPRAADPADLLRQYEELTGKTAQAEPDLKAAINAAARAVGRDDLILVTGSFYLAGDAKQLLMNNAKKQARAARVAAGV